jgi:hypothetical protein
VASGRRVDAARAQAQNASTEQAEDRDDRQKTKGGLVMMSSLVSPPPPPPPVQDRCLRRLTRRG